LSEKAFNQNLFVLIARFLPAKLDIEDICATRPKTISLDSKILLHFDEYFKWPSLDNPVYGAGTC